MAEQKKTEISAVQRAKLEAILKDPVLWAKAFVVVQDPITKTYGPWIARDYQAECLRNRDLRKVYRFGRRLGKTEIMCIDALWQCFTHKNYRVLFITPYDNQAALIFRRLREIIMESPMIKAEVVKMKSSPHTVEFSNGSIILGFTTGASSNQGAASIRGQRGDWLFLDELDYMGEEDYAVVSSIATERADIGITASSTPTGHRGVFYSMCTDLSWGYTAWHIPSQHSPFYTEEMDIQEKATKTQAQYEHEILAEFGIEEAGVFPKDKVDGARKKLFYTYTELNKYQLKELEGQIQPLQFIFKKGDRAPQNLIRTVGVDIIPISA